jgi:hypothetical protein
VYSRHTLREGARADDVRDILGHANIDVTRNVYGKNCWEEREDAVTQAVEAMTNAAQNAEKEENQPQQAGPDLQVDSTCPAGRVIVHLKWSFTSAVSAFDQKSGD